MGKNLRKMATVLHIADQLHTEGKLETADYIKILATMEENYKNPQEFTTEITNWCADLMLLDNSSGHLNNLKTLVESFLASPDADDRKHRNSVLSMVVTFKKLLVCMAEYEEGQLIKKYLNMNK